MTSEYRQDILYHRHPDIQCDVWVTPACGIESIRSREVSLCGMWVGCRSLD